MLVSFLGRLFKFVPLSPVGRCRAARRRAWDYRPLLLALEDRTLLSTITWLHPVSGDWDEAANWAGGRVPTAGDDAVIPFAGIRVTHATSPVNSVHTLISEAAIDISAGALALGSTSRIDDVCTISGGTLFLNNVTLGGAGRLINRGTINLFVSTINVGLRNETGVVVATGLGLPSAINNQAGQPFANGPGATLRVLGRAALTVAHGFTNEGRIDLQTTTRFATRFAVADGTLVNAPEATIDIGGDSLSSVTVSADLDNQGLINAGWGTLGKHSGTVTNRGTIAVGGLHLSGLTVSQSAFTNRGTIMVGSHRDSSSTFTVSGGTFDQEGVVDGQGTLVLRDTIANFPGDVSNAVTNLAIQNTTLNSPGALTNEVGRLLDITGSTINASVVNHDMLLVDESGSITPNADTVINGALSNDGFFATVLVQSAAIPASLTVTRGVMNRGRIQLSSFEGASPSELTVTTGTLTNRGVILTLGDGGPMVLNAALDNQGSLFLQRGMICTGSVVSSGSITLFNGDLTVNLTDSETPFVNTGGISVSSLRGFIVEGGDLVNAGSVTVDPFGTLLVTGEYEQTAGMTALNSGSLTAGTLVNLEGGTLAGSGMVNADVRNNAEVDVGRASSTGVLTVNGNYTQTAGGVLRVRIGGLTPGTDFDQLNVTGQATLDGTLTVNLINGFVPDSGQSFTVLTFGSGSGVFARITGDGPRFTPSYDPGVVTLVAN
jgi:hypothetical protein